MSSKHFTIITSLYVLFIFSFFIACSEEKEKVQRKSAQKPELPKTPEPVTHPQSMFLYVPQDYCASQLPIPSKFDFTDDLSLLRGSVCESDNAEEKIFKVSLAGSDGYPTEYLKIQCSFSAELDPESLSTTDTFQWRVHTSSTSTSAERPLPAVILFEMPVEPENSKDVLKKPEPVKITLSLSSDSKTLQIQPENKLKPGTEYGVIVTKALRGKEKGQTVPSKNFSEIISNELFIDDSDEKDPHIAELKRDINRMTAWFTFAHPAIYKSDYVSAWTFRTQTSTSSLSLLNTQIENDEIGTATITIDSVNPAPTSPLYGSIQEIYKGTFSLNSGLKKITVDEHGVASVSLAQTQEYEFVITKPNGDDSTLFPVALFLPDELPTSSEFSKSIDQITWSANFLAGGGFVTIIIEPLFSKDSLPIAHPGQLRDLTKDVTAHLMQVVHLIRSNQFERKGGPKFSTYRLGIFAQGINAIPVSNVMATADVQTVAFYGGGLHFLEYFIDNESEYHSAFQTQLAELGIIDDSAEITEYKKILSAILDPVNMVSSQSAFKKFQSALFIDIENNQRTPKSASDNLKNLLNLEDSSKFYHLISGCHDLIFFEPTKKAEYECNDGSISIEDAQALQKEITQYLISKGSNFCKADGKNCN